MNTIAAGPGLSAGGRLVKSLPAAVAAKLTEQDKAAIVETVDAGGLWQRHHPVDARYSFRWFQGRVYLRILAGREDRPPARARQDARLGAARSLVNIALIGVGAALFYTVAGLGILAASSAIG